jgi:uncharacterized damage-inducible protein DinB
MTIAASLLPEFDHEMYTTRTLLQRVPEEHGEWRPHPRSTTLGGLAMHVANIPSWTVATLRTSSLDLATPEGESYRPPRFTTTDELLAHFARTSANARAAIAEASDEVMSSDWLLRMGDHVIMTGPRVNTLRSFVMNHLIHHRGQLSVYLRLNNVALPRIYGPTADEP